MEPSLLYALLTLKNIILNPNQNPNGFFNYGFVNLGGFDAVVFDYQTRNEIELGITLEKDSLVLMYQVAVGENKGSFTLAIEGRNDFKAKIQIPVSFPYPANQQTQQSISRYQKSFVVTWDGIVAQVQPGEILPPLPSDVPDKQALPPLPPDKKVQEEATNLAVSLNAPVEMLRKVSVVPLKRGFCKPHYRSDRSMGITEDEVAASLSTNKYLVSGVSFYLEQIFERDFRTHFSPGTYNFSLDSTDKKAGVASELVNEGFGVNQVVYLLATCLHRDTELVWVEEPEIHLHPTAVRGVARALVQIIHDEEKRFVISTHSESFLLALLTLVAKGELKPSELACYLARKEKKSTQFERQIVNEKGQIEGGLTSFMEGELEDIRDFLKVMK